MREKFNCLNFKGISEIYHHYQNEEFLMLVIPAIGNFTCFLIVRKVLKKRQEKKRKLSRDMYFTHEAKREIL